MRAVNGHGLSRCPCNQGYGVRGMAHRKVSTGLGHSLRASAVRPAHTTVLHPGDQGVWAWSRAFEHRRKQQRLMPEDRVRAHLAD
jgi:hypothetical protein